MTLEPSDVYAPVKAVGYAFAYGVAYALDLSIMVGAFDDPTSLSLNGAARSGGELTWDDQREGRYFDDFGDKRNQNGTLYRDGASQRAFVGSLKDAGSLSAGEQAHHIVSAGKTNDYAAQARDILDTYGINFNGPENGVGLKNHANHSVRYDQAVLDRIKNRNDGEDVVDELALIAVELQAYDIAISSGFYESDGGSRLVSLEVV